MLLSVQDLLNLRECPDEQDLTLQTVAEFYEAHLCNRIFHFHVRHKVRDIKLHFKTVDLPHLLGVHKMKTGSDHRGKKGFPALRSGNITLGTLKKANVGAYDATILRILHFPFVYQLVYDAKAIVFRPELARSMIDAEFMFYNVFSKRYILLGVRKERSTNLYTPVTFLERKNLYPNMTHMTIESLNVYPESEEFTVIESAAADDNLRNLFD